MYNATVRADSINAHTGDRITTLEVTMPRCILAQFNTHRMFSRNSASSRAIPVEKFIAKVKDNPLKPLRWGTAQRGMVAGAELTPIEQLDAEHIWDGARKDMIWAAERLAKLGVAKEIVNRLLEPFSWTTVLVTSTEWANFFKLRLAYDAQPEMTRTAEEMFAAMQNTVENSTPVECSAGDWHIPFGERMPEGLTLLERIKIATARCARLSYLTHDGQFAPARDFELHDQLLANGHLSPLEHCACIELLGLFPCANFTGWMSYRYHVERQMEIN